MNSPKGQNIVKIRGGPIPKNIHNHFGKLHMTRNVIPRKIRDNFRILHIN